MKRTDPIESPTTCMIRIERDGMWYDMRPLTHPTIVSRRIIARLRRKGRVVWVKWFTGMGLEC